MIHLRSDDPHRRACEIVATPAGDHIGGEDSYLSVPRLIVKDMDDTLLVLGEDGEIHKDCGDKPPCKRTAHNTTECNDRAARE